MDVNLEEAAAEQLEKERNILADAVRNLGPHDKAILILIEPDEDVPNLAHTAVFDYNHQYWHEALGTLGSGDGWIKDEMHKGNRDAIED